MRRLLQRFYYLTETLMTRSPIYQLLLVALVIGLLSVGGGLLVHMTEPRAYRDISEAIWWAFLRLTDPGYLGDDQGLMPRLISTLLTISGYVVFLGALVAIMTAWLNQLMNFLASGRSPIFERDHVLLIGWSDHIHALVEEVVHTWHRLIKGDARPAIAILCDPYRPGMQRELMQKLDPKVRQQCRLLVRSGNPLEVESLERVDYQHARSVILVSQARGDRQQGQLSDMALAKILMTLKARAPQLPHPPNVVVEVSNPANKLLLESVGWPGHTESVVGEQILGQLFCQTVRYPGLSRVYRRLLTDSYGDSLGLLPAASVGSTGLPLLQQMGELKAGLPIGVLPSGGTQSQLRLLDFHTPIAPDDQLVLVISNGPRSDRQLPSGQPLEDVVWSQTSPHPSVRRLLCLGWSTLLLAILSEMGTYQDERFELVLLWDGDQPRERERLLRLQQAHTNLSLDFQLGTIVDEEEVGRLRPERFDTVVLLSDQRRDTLVGDAETVLQYVLLERYYRQRELPIWFVVELTDEDNRPLIQGEQVDVVMTAEIASHLLAQVAIHRSLAWIYEELFAKGGSELRLRGLAELGAAEELTFAACQKAALANRSVALGVRTETDMVLDPDGSYLLRGKDRLITVEME